MSLRNTWYHRDQHDEPLKWHLFTDYAVEDGGPLLLEISSEHFQFCAVLPDDLAQKILRGANSPTCSHNFDSNPGLYDTLHRYCTKCGIAE